MSQIKWTNPAGGDFATASNWSTGTVPGSSDDAIFSLAGPYTVTSNQNESVNSLQMVQGVTLAIGGNSIFDAINGSGSGSDAGVISVGNDSYFEVGGTLAGAGTVQLNSTGNGTRFQLEANTTLSGGGKLVLGDNANNYVISDGGPYTLTNVNDTISGAGQFLYDNTSFTNGAAGVVNANATNNEFVVNAGSGVITNAGLFESTGAGGLDILNSTITQTGTGTIKAVGAGHVVTLDRGSISGGTLTTTGGGVIESVSNGYLANVTITAGSTIAALNNTFLYAAGTINNKGTIAIDSAGNATRFEVNSGTLTLTGAGAVVLTDSGSNYIYAGTSADLLINVNNTISGAGQLDYNNLAVNNEAAGVIDATGTVNALVVDTGGSAFSNEGLLEDTGAGGLSITDGTVIVNTGTILAAGSSSAVDLNTGSIQGGTLKTTGGGVIQSVNNFELDGSTTHGAITIATGSQIVVDNNAYLTLAGSIVNDSTISVDSVGNGTRLQIAGTVTLTGGGKVTLSDNGANYIYSVNQTDKLINVNNTISGAGELTYNFLTVDNQIGGVIDATGTVNALIVDTGGSAFTNEGLLEATGTGGLEITDNSVITNTGTVLAAGAGSNINLNNGSINGGTVSTRNGGVLDITGNGGLYGGAAGTLTLTTGTQVAIVNNDYGYINDTIVNEGTISLDSIGNGTRLEVNGTVTLTGGGAIALSDNTQNYLYSENQNDKLINVNNTITGSGSLTYNYLSLDNQAAGIINSTGTAGMVFDNPNANTITNEGLIEDTGTGGIIIVNGAAIINSGTFLATGAGSNINLSNGSINGGIVSTTNGGVVDVTGNGGLYGGASGTLTLTTGTQVDVLNNQYAYIDDTIVNKGTISLESAGNGTRLEINGTTTLTGSGTIALSDNSQNYFFSQNQNDRLINVNNTITGSGSLTYNLLSLDNQAAGIINSTGTAGIVFDNPNANTITNEGLIEDTGTGGIVIVNGAAIINSGTFLANGAGSNINLSNGSINGGSVSTSNGGVIEITGNGGLYGAGNGALTITAGSQVVVENNEDGYLQGSIVNEGTISLESVGNGTRLYINGTVMLSGGGTVALSDNTQNYIYSENQKDTLVNVNNTIEGAGQLAYNYLNINNEAAGTIDATGANQLVLNSGGEIFTNEGLAEGSGAGGLFIQATTVTNSGTFAALSGSSFTLNSDAPLTNFSAGTLTGGTYEAISSGGTNTATMALNSLTAITTDAATIILSGAGSSITAGGTAVATTLTTVTAAGKLEVLNGATFASGLAATGTLAISGTLDLTGTLTGSNVQATVHSDIVTTNGSGTLSVTGKVFNFGTVMAGSGGSLLIGQGALKNSGLVEAVSGGTLTTKTTNLAAGTLTGGTWSAIGAGSTLNITTGTITTDAAILTIDGTGAAITGGLTHKALSATLTTIASTGQLKLLDGVNFNATATGGLSDAGTLTLGGGTLSGDALSITGSVLGIGAITSTVTDNGTLGAGATGVAAGTLTLTKAVTGTGALTVTGGDTLNTAGYAVGSVTVAATGTLVGAGSATGAISDAGTLLLNGGTLAGATITTTGAASLISGSGVIADSVTNGGTINAVGTLTLAAGESGGKLTVAAGGTLISTAAAVSATGLTIAAGGSFIGIGAISGTVADSGTLAASGGTLSVSAASGTGAITIASGSDFTITGPLAVSGGLSFLAGSNETLGIGHPFDNTTVISDFGNGDTIDVLNTTVTRVSFAPATNDLSLFNGSTKVGNLFLAGSYTSTSFGLQTDGNGGTDIVYAGGAQSVGGIADLQGAAAQVAPLAPTAPTAAQTSYAPEAPALSLGGAASAQHHVPTDLALLFHHQ